MAILKVNGSPISAQAIRAEAARLREEGLSNGGEIGPDAALRCLALAEELLIERVLLEQEAARLAIPVAPREVGAALAQLLPPGNGAGACRAGMDSAETRAEMERRLRIDKLVELWTAGVQDPPARTVRQAYAAYRDRFYLPESLFVVQIVKNVHHADEREDARRRMYRVAQELRDGADFSALARHHSDCPGGGGTLGFLSRGEMVPEFEEIVFALPLYRASPVFETRFGFHIAKVTQRRPAGSLPFSEAAPRIASALITQAKQREVEARLRALRSRADVRRVDV